MSEEYGPRTRKEDIAIYKRHLQAINNPEKKVDNSPPRITPDTFFNVGNYQSDAMKLSIIEALNRELVRKINIVYRTRGKVDNSEPNLLYKSNYFERKRENSLIERENKKIYKGILQQESRIKTRDLLSDYAYMRRHYLKSKGRDPDEKPLSQAVVWSIVPTDPPFPPDPSKRIKCFLDIEATHEIRQEMIQLGRVIIEVYLDYAPISGENFVRLCRGDNDVTYKGTIFHKVFPKFACFAGDTQNRKGLGGQSSYGIPFPNEDAILEFAGPGVVGTYSPEKGENTSQFLITFAEIRPLKKRFVPFGKIVAGRSLDMIEDLGTKSGFPLMVMTIVNCGVISPEKEKAPRYGEIQIPTELTNLLTRLQVEEERERKKQEVFEEKQMFYKTYGYMTKLNPSLPYPPFPWKKANENTTEAKAAANQIIDNVTAAPNKKTVSEKDSISDEKDPAKGSSNESNRKEA